MTLRICDCCGAALDPCERCDCQNEKAAVEAYNKPNNAEEMIPGENRKAV